MGTVKQIHALCYGTLEINLLANSYVIPRCNAQNFGSFIAKPLALNLLVNFISKEKEKRIV